MTRPSRRSSTGSWTCWSSSTMLPAHRSRMSFSSMRRPPKRRRTANSTWRSTSSRSPESGVDARGGGNCGGGATGAAAAGDKAEANRGSSCNSNRKIGGIEAEPEAGGRFHGGRTGGRDLLERVGQAHAGGELSGSALEDFTQASREVRGLDPGVGLVVAQQFLNGGLRDADREAARQLPRDGARDPVTALRPGLLRRRPGQHFAGRGGAGKRGKNGGQRIGPRLNISAKVDGEHLLRACAHQSSFPSNFCCAACPLRRATRLWWWRMRKASNRGC